MLNPKRYRKSTLNPKRHRKRPLNEILNEISGERNVTPDFSLHLGSKLIHPLGSAGGPSMVTAMMTIARPAEKMRFVQNGDLTDDLHLSIFPCLVSDRRSEPIITHIEITVNHWRGRFCSLVHSDYS